jgi:hypothetical protein
MAQTCQLKAMNDRVGLVLFGGRGWGFFCGIGVWTQGFTLATQALYP